jgi:hypothetical protein
MGFFRSAILRTHAENISRGFGAVRNQHFDHTVRALRDQLGSELIPSGVEIGGEADLVLRGFQLWLYLAFSIVHPYVSGKQESELSGCIVASLSGAYRKQVEEYFLKFNEYRNNYVDLVCQVAFPVAQRIMPDLDPRTLIITAKLLPFLAINTQIVIAEEFRDKATADNLDSQMKIMHSAMELREGEKLSGSAMHCFNCGCSFNDETKCCSLCGVPLIFLDPVNDPHPAAESGLAGARTAQWREGSTPVLDSRIAEAALAEIPAEMVEKGIHFRQNHFRGISDWEERMYSEFGDRVVPLLGEIWNRTS